MKCKTCNKGIGDSGDFYNSLCGFHKKVTTNQQHKNILREKKKELGLLLETIDKMKRIYYMFKPMSVPDIEEMYYRADCKVKQILDVQNKITVDK
jgi:hypothetical protein